MPPERHFEAIVFDLDGVIIDTERSIHDVWAEVFTTYGCSFSEAEWHGLIGTDDDSSPYAWLSERATVALPSRDELVQLVSARQHRAVELLTPLPGVVSWIEEARSHGLRLAVASSSSRAWVEARLSQVGVLDAFEAIACPDQDHRAKPAPDLYLAACSSLRVAPERALAVEDSHNGLVAASAAGLCTIAVPTELTMSLDLTAAELRLASLGEVSLSEVLVLLERVEQHDACFVVRPAPPA